VGKFAVTAFEYSMTGQQPQDAIQRIRIGAGGLGQCRCGLWRIAESVSDSKIGSGVSVRDSHVVACEIGADIVKLNVPKSEEAAAAAPKPYNTLTMSEAPSTNKAASDR